MGMPSSSTSVRLADVPPKPRSAGAELAGDMVSVL